MVEACLESTSCNLVVREPAMIAPYQPPPTPYPTPPPIIHLPHLPPRSTCICPAKNSVPSILLQQREVVFSKLKGCNASCYNPLSIESPKKMSHHEWTFAKWKVFSQGFLVSQIYLDLLYVMLGSLVVVMPGWVNKRRNSLDAGEETIKGRGRPLGLQSHLPPGQSGLYYQHPPTNIPLSLHPPNPLRGWCPRQSITEDYQCHLYHHKETSKTVINSFISGFLSIHNLIHDRWLRWYIVHTTQQFHMVKMRPLCFPLNPNTFTLGKPSWTLLLWHFVGGCISGFSLDLGNVIYLKNKLFKDMNITQHLQIRYDQEEGGGNIGDDDDNDDEETLARLFLVHGSTQMARRRQYLA